jgi:hypothetical protein
VCITEKFSITRARILDIIENWNVNSDVTPLPHDLLIAVGRRFISKSGEIDVEARTTAFHAESVFEFFIGTDDRIYDRVLNALLENSRSGLVSGKPINPKWKKLFWTMIELMRIAVDRKGRSRCTSDP